MESTPELEREKWKLAMDKHIAKCSKPRFEAEALIQLFDFLKERDIKIKFSKDEFIGADGNPYPISEFERLFFDQIDRLKKVTEDFWRED